MEKYLFDHPSPIVADLIMGAIRFFAEDCRDENGKRDWRAIKKRKQRGLGFRLEDDTEITTEISFALQNWIMIEGRDIGGSFMDEMFDFKLGNSANPRNEAHEILKFFNK